MKAAWALAIALVCLAMGQAIAVTDSLLQPPQDQTTTSQQDTREASEEGVVADTGQEAEDPLIAYTYWLMWFTGALVAATLLLATIAFVQLLYFARKERAFVFQKDIDIQFIEARDGGVREWAFTVAWINSGGTPTRELRYRVTHDLRDDPYPLGHPFADKPDERDHRAVIGPGGSVACMPIEVHVVDIEPVSQGKKHLYIWGWAEYRSAFWLSRKYRTEFCIGIIIQPKKGDRARIGMPLHDEHNTAN